MLATLVKGTYVETNFSGVEKDLGVWLELLQMSTLCAACDRLGHDAGK